MSMIDFQVGMTMFALFVFQMDANNLADHIVSFFTCGKLLTPMKEINKAKLHDAVDL